MYEPAKRLVTRLLRAPTEPPRVPAGAYRSVQVLRASPRWLSYRLVGFWIGASVAGLAFAVATVAVLVAEPWTVLLVLLVAAPVALLLALAWFAVRLDYDLRHYVITDRSLRVREGAWSLAEMTLTYANVQNVRIEQGPLQRLFRISDLVVDTAGGGASSNPRHGATSGHHVRLAGLEDAEGVRDLVLAYVKEFGRSSGLGDLDDPGERARAGLRASPELLQALRALRDEASALRRAAETRA